MARIQARPLHVVIGETCAVLVCCASVLVHLFTGLIDTGAK